MRVGLITVLLFKLFSRYRQLTFSSVLSSSYKHTTYSSFSFPKDPDIACQNMLISYRVINLFQKKSRKKRRKHSGVEWEIDSDQELHKHLRLSTADDGFPKLEQQPAGEQTDRWISNTRDSSATLQRQHDRHLLITSMCTYHGLQGVLTVFSAIVPISQGQLLVSLFVICGTDEDGGGIRFNLQQRNKHHNYGQQ